jgi:hypothetical protein
MNTLPETILQRARSLPEGGVLSPKEFLHQGSRAESGRPAAARPANGLKPYVIVFPTGLQETSSQ